MAAQEPLLKAPAPWSTSPRVDPRTRRGSLNDAGKSDGEEWPSPRERHLGILGAVASVMNAVIGTGILALPVAFTGVGTVFGTLLIVFCAFVCFVSLLALGKVVTHVGACSYGEAMDKTIGGPSGVIISAVVAAFCFGVCIVYSVVISTNLVDLLNEQGLITQPIFPGSPAECAAFWCMDNRRFWIVAPAVGILMPLCLLPNFDKLKYAAMFATSSMVYLTGVIAVYLFISASRDGAVPIWKSGIETRDDAAPDVRTPIGPQASRVTGALLHPLICCVPLYTPDDGIPGCDAVGDPACCDAQGDETCCTPEVLAEGILPWNDPGIENFIIDSDVFTSFSTFLFAFLTHTMIPQVVVELTEPSTKRLAMMMGGVCSGSLGLYYFVGLTGYLLFGNCVCDNISISFGPDGWVAVGQGFVVTSVCCGYATVCWPCRDALLDIFYPLYLKCDLYYLLLSSCDPPPFLAPRLSRLVFPS